MADPCIHLENISDAQTRVVVLKTAVEITSNPSQDDLVKALNNLEINYGVSAKQAAERIAEDTLRARIGLA
jgi:hypothetical protein